MYDLRTDHQNHISYQCRFFLDLDPTLRYEPSINITKITLQPARGYRENEDVRFGRVGPR